MDTLTIALLILFVSTVLGTILQRRARDPCLKKFHDVVIFLQLKSGRWVWGNLKVYSKSLELVYETPNPDQAGHQELSYLIFEDMLPQIQVLVHSHPKRGTEESHVWKRDLEKLVSPSLWVAFRRSCRNVFNTVRDAFSQSIGILVGVVRARNPAAMLAGVDQKLTSTGQMLVSQGNNAYEPILEKYLGKDVVVEILVGEKWLEHIGLLEEYSDKYILLRDVRLHAAIPLPEQAGSLKRADVIFPRAHSTVRHLAVRGPETHAVS